MTDCRQMSFCHADITITAHTSILPICTAECYPGHSMLSSKHLSDLGQLSGCCCFCYRICMRSHRAVLRPGAGCSCCHLHCRRLTGSSGDELHTPQPHGIKQLYKSRLSIQRPSLLKHGRQPLWGCEIDAVLMCRPSMRSSPVQREA